MCGDFLQSTQKAGAEFKVPISISFMSKEEFLCFLHSILLIHVCGYAHVEVRGHLVRVSSLLLPHGSQDHPFLHDL